MKILLACLMCLVLTMSECFALKGGPEFGKGQVTTTGIYAGVLVPQVADNSLGIFRFGRFNRSGELDYINNVHIDDGPDHGRHYQYRDHL